MLDKYYQPDLVEEKIYKQWEEDGDFKAPIDSKNKHYSIVIPPPNVTGNLHMGHALNNTLQDILIRFYRMKGRDVLWQPGTDHAGIATEMVVERELKKQKIKKANLSREEFIEHVWKWKDSSGNKIINQLKRLGCSCDWSRERFTLDEGLSKSVRHVFVKLYKDGLVYKDKRLSNWDPKLKTTISDLEVIQKEVTGTLWYINYKIENEDGYITIATTRPETMLGDTAIAVHPEDKKYKDLVGKFAILPIVEKRIPIVADEYVKMDQGSGAVKITPAHDFNDYEIGKRHDLELITCLDFDGNIENKDFIPEELRGIDRFNARERIVEMLEENGILVSVEDHQIQIPKGDRSKTILEPMVSEQWFVKTEEIAKKAIKVVEEDDIKFIPKNWEKTYFEWMYNIQDWCISRQQWWGHRIPAWYDEAQNHYVGKSEADVREKHDLADDVKLIQDEDVLDTWFSSALWPFSTLGWPEETDDLKNYYPTSLLVTGFDIIFFWVARMIMMGLYTMENIPFKDILIHGLVRDSKGRKMSKQLGNSPDALELISLYGADSVRVGLMLSSAAGNDLLFDESLCKQGKSFCNKIWNSKLD